MKNKTNVMKKLLLLIFAVFVSCKQENKSTTEHNHNHVPQTKTTQKKVLSPHKTTMESFAGAHIHIDYSSPGVRNRIIFGGLLPFNEIWQAGAHNATWIETNRDLLIEGKKLPAGKYGFFVIPSKEMWTIIFNTRWNQHGKDEYNQEEDVLRLNVKPNYSEEIKEHLEYTITKKSDTSGTISLSWEKVSVSFNFTVIN